MNLKVSEIFLDFLEKFDQNQSMEFNFDIEKFKKMLKLEHKVLFLLKNKINSSVNTLDFFVKIRIHLYANTNCKLPSYQEIKKLLNDEQKKIVFHMSFLNFEKFKVIESFNNCFSQMIEKNEMDDFINRFNQVFKALNTQSEEIILKSLIGINKFSSQLIKRLIELDRVKEAEKIQILLKDNIIEKKNHHYF